MSVFTTTCERIEIYLITSEADAQSFFAHVCFCDRLLITINFLKNASLELHSIHFPIQLLKISECSYSANASIKRPRVSFYEN